MNRCILIFLLGFHSTFAMTEDEPPTQIEIEQGTLIEASPYSEIEADLMDQYFKKKPGKFLVDPQGLIASEHGRHLEKILDNHSLDSAIDLYLFVYRENQKLPENNHTQVFLGRHFSDGKPVVLIYYYDGKPDRTEIFLSQGIAKVVSTSERQRSVQSSIVRAMRANGSFEQLEEFLMQFSVRTYWMERMMEESSELVPEASPAGRIDAAPTQQDNTGIVDLIPVKFRGSALIAAFVLGAFLLLLCLIFWLRSRARYQFPEFEVEARLGASHAAGIGAVVNFSSSAVSPARQREQVPEYLRRA